MNETTEEKKTTEGTAAAEAKKPVEEKKAPAVRWQKWVFLLIAAADLVNAAINTAALMELFDIRRLFAVVIWLVAALCFGIAAYSAWKEDKSN